MSAALAKALDAAGLMVVPKSGDDWLYTLMADKRLTCYQKVIGFNIWKHCHSGPERVRLRDIAIKETTSLHYPLTVLEHYNYIKRKGGKGHITLFTLIPQVPRENLRQTQSSHHGSNGAGRVPA